MALRGNQLQRPPSLSAGPWIFCVAAGTPARSFQRESIAHLLESTAAPFQECADAHGICAEKRHHRINCGSGWPLAERASWATTFLACAATFLPAAA